MGLLVGTIDGEYECGNAYSEGQRRSPEKYEMIPDHSPLSVRLTVETMAGVTAAFVVSPFVSIIDKAITTNASGVEPLVPAVKNGLKTLFFRPIYFLKQPSFLFIWGVFSGTYAVANNVEALCGRDISVPSLGTKLPTSSHSASEQSSYAEQSNQIKPLYPKFLCTAFTNVTLSVAKDYAFARMFGKGPMKPMSRTSLGIFAIRDSMTILASFTLPPMIAEELVNKMAFTSKNAEITAQLLAPVSMQILSTPLHILGLDLYNKSSRDVKFSERLMFIKQEYLKTLMARVSRIFPAFGIGGVLNKQLRRQGHAFIHNFSVYNRCKSSYM
jgi:hypothetical protein